MNDDYSRFLGVDHGTKRIGLAVSDPLKITARPLSVVPNTGNAAVFEAIAAVVKEQDISRIIIGLPTDSKSEIGAQAALVLAWAKVLAAHITLPIRLWDESYSTVEASARQQRHKRASVDAYAAAAILQDYLDAGGGQAHEPGRALESF